jgi:hypothetical protein
MKEPLELNPEETYRLARREALELYPEETYEIFDPNEAMTVAIFYHRQDAEEYLAWRNRVEVE